jgi:hypothetical protein
MEAQDSSLSPSGDEYEIYEGKKVYPFFCSQNTKAYENDLEEV